MKIWEFYYKNKFCWFRIFGKGLQFKDTSIHPLLFSERYNFKKGIQIGKWRINYLK